MSDYLFSHETLIRLAVFMVLGFVFWGSMILGLRLKEISQKVDA